MLNDLVMEYLSLSDKMRKGYKDSLELRARHGMKLFSGYRLIHIEELEKEYHTLLQMIASDDICEARIRTIIPLLANYSSCYITLV